MTLGELSALVKAWQDERQRYKWLNNTMAEIDLAQVDTEALSQQAAQHAQTLRDAAEMLDGFLDAPGGVSHYPADVRAVADWLARAGER